MVQIVKALAVKTVSLIPGTHMEGKNQSFQFALLTPFMHVGTCMCVHAHTHTHSNKVKKTNKCENKTKIILHTS